MKKILSAFLLTLAMVSCGKKEEKNAMSEELKGKVVVQVEESWKPYYEAAVKRVVEKHPSVEVELKVVPSFDHIEVIDKTDVTNKDVADVFAVPLDKSKEMYERDALAAFDAKALGDRVGGFGDYDNGLGGKLKVDDKYVGFPFNIETLVLGINKENAKAQGINLEEKVDFAKLDPKAALIPVFNAWWGVAITNSANVELLGEDGDKFYSDLTKDYADLTPEAKAMFEGLFNYWKAANSKKLPIFDTSAVYGYMDDQFKNGKEGSLRIIGPWEIGAVTNVIGDNFEVKGLDASLWMGQMLKHWKGGWALVINARNEGDPMKLAIAQEVIAEIMNPKFAGDFYKITGKIMPNVTKEEYAAMEINELDKKVILAVLDSYADAVTRPLFKEWGQVWGTWENALLSWESVKPSTVEEAYKQVQASFKALLTNLGQ